MILTCMKDPGSSTLYEDNNRRTFKRWRTIKQKCLYILIPLYTQNFYRIYSAKSRHMLISMPPTPYMPINSRYRDVSLSLSDRPHPNLYRESQSQEKQARSAEMPSHAP